MDGDGCFAGSFDGVRQFVDVITELVAEAAEDIVDTLGVPTGFDGLVIVEAEGYFDEGVADDRIFRIGRIIEGGVIDEGRYFFVALDGSVEGTVEQLVVKHRFHAVVTPFRFERFLSEVSVYEVFKVLFEFA
jgi:hypothetical protein